MFKLTAAAGLYVLVQTLSVIAEPHVWMRSSLKAMNTLGQIIKKSLTKGLMHGLRTPGEEIAFTARPRINSHFQIFRYNRCLPHRTGPNLQIFFFHLYLHCPQSVTQILNLLNEIQQARKGFRPPSAMQGFFLIFFLKFLRNFSE